MQKNVKDNREISNDGFMQNTIKHVTLHLIFVNETVNIQRRLCIFGRWFICFCMYVNKINQEYEYI